jgi:hypothetical protein
MASELNLDFLLQDFFSFRGKKFEQEKKKQSVSGAKEAEPNPTPSAHAQLI